MRYYPRYILHRLPNVVIFPPLGVKKKKKKNKRVGESRGEVFGQFTRGHSGIVVSHLDNTLRSTRSRKAHSRKKERTIFEGSAGKKEERRKIEGRERGGGEERYIWWRRLEVAELAPRKDRYLNDRV